MSLCTEPDYAVAPDEQLEAPAMDPSPDAPADDALSVGPEAPELPVDEMAANTEACSPLASSSPMEEPVPAELEEEVGRGGEVTEEPGGDEQEGEAVPQLQREPEEQNPAEQEEGQSNEVIADGQAEGEGEGEVEGAEAPAESLPEEAQADSREAGVEESASAQEQEAQDELEEEEEEETEDEECCSLRMRSALKRKNRPCSLPVSELETVIASACGEPETPRTHYIRIHHLLHSLPSAQLSQDPDLDPDPDPDPDPDLDSDEPTVKPPEDKEEAGEDSASEAVSQTLASEEPGPCCRRTLPRSLSIERLSDLNQLLEGERPRPDSESEAGGGRPPGESECDLCDNSCYSTSCYSTSCYSTSCYSNSGYEGRNRFCSHTRFSSVDSARMSESTVFSSQDEEEEEENSAFESAPDSVQSPEGREAGDRAAQWPGEPREPEGSPSSDAGDSPVAGPSGRAGGEWSCLRDFTEKRKQRWLSPLFLLLGLSPPPPPSLFLSRLCFSKGVTSQQSWW